MTSGGKIAVEMTVGGKPKSGASHQPWKSLCDSHIPTARLLLYIFLKPFSRKEPSSPPAPSRFRLILRLEKTGISCCPMQFLRTTGLRVPFVCTETHEMGEEILASYLYQVHLYQWLEENGFGSCLKDGDL